MLYNCMLSGGYAQHGVSAEGFGCWGGWWGQTAAPRLWAERRSRLWSARRGLRQWGHAEGPARGASWSLLLGLRPPRVPVRLCPSPSLRVQPLLQPWPTSVTRRLFLLALGTAAFPQQQPMSVFFCSTGPHFEHHCRRKPFNILRTQLLLHILGSDSYSTLFQCSSCL